jgi:hypothetical protein
VSPSASVSLATRSLAGNVSGTSSIAVLLSVVATGASLTLVTVTVTDAKLDSAPAVSFTR